MPEPYKNPLRGFCKLGERFYYLGVYMVAVAFYEEEEPCGGFQGTPHRMECEYLDAHGIIQTKTFQEYHLLALYNQRNNTN